MKKEYDLDFKLKAIAMSNEGGSISSVARQLDVKGTTLISWRFLYKKGKLTEGQKKYSLDFKLKAIAMSHERGSKSTTACQLNIPESKLKRWRSGPYKAKLTGIPSILKRRKKYDLNFKLKAIAMSHEKGSKSSVAQQLDVNIGTLRYWRVEYWKGKFTKEPPSGKGYNLEFKLKAITMSRKIGSIPVIAKQLGIAKRTLDFWWTSYRKGRLTGKRPNEKSIRDLKINSLNIELRKSRKELTKVTLERELLKQVYPYLLLKRSEKLQFILQHESVFPIKAMCDTLKIAYCNYFCWRKRLPSKTSKNEILLEEIKRIYWENKGQYG